MHINTKITDRGIGGVCEGLDKIVHRKLIL